MTTISTSSSGIVLSSSFTNPVIIDPGVTVQSTGTAIADTTSTTTPFTITNQGTVIGSSGIELHASGSTVTNVAGAVISGTSAGFGIRFLTGATNSTVVNSGTIRSSLHSGVAYISNTAGGDVVNNASGLITGFTQGVYIEGGTVTNAGLITGTATTSSTLGFGINLRLGTNTVNNQSGGLVQGVTVGVYGNSSSTNDAITNAGAITGGNRGIQINSANAHVVNSAGGTITATGSTGIGVDLLGGGTIDNAGSISATGTAIYLGGAGASNRLIVEQGSTITGTVTGNASAFNTVELAASSSLSGLGTQYVNFSELDADTTASLTGTNVLGAGFYVGGAGVLTNTGTINETSVTGSQTIGSAGFVNDATILVGTNDVLLLQSAVTTDAGQAGTIEIAGNGVLETEAGIDQGQTVTFASNSGSLVIDDTADFAGTIANFSAGDDLDLDNLFFSSDATATLAGDTLTVTTDFQSATLTLTGVAAGATFNVIQDQNGGSQVVEQVPCYCPGTLILTENGEVPVEKLAIGDRVVTLSGAKEPIRWIGRRRYAGRFAAGQRHLLPVCIRAGALAENTPRRDLYVSPLHALLIDGLLVLAGELVNGVSVVQVQNPAVIEYIHIELAAHDIVWAEGTPAETFVEDANRNMFHNASEFAAIYPAANSMDAVYCAPRVQAGYELEAIRTRIDARAGSLSQAA